MYFWLMKDSLNNRTKEFSLEVIRLFSLLKKSEEGRILGWQLLRASTSVGANYRAARRARSRAEFYAKMCIVVEEIDEVGYWLDLVEEAKLLKVGLPIDVKREANELLYIFSTSRKSAKP